MGGGGVSGAQKNQAAGQLSGLGGTAQTNMGQQYGQMQQNQQQVTPFYQNQMKTGLPFYRSMTDYSGGDVARAFAPARADILRRTSQMTNMPSGYRDALLNNLNAQQGTAFDSQLRQAMMANQMAKEQGAAGLQGQEQIAGGQGLGYGQLGAGANQAILQAPQKPSVWGTLGGLAMQGMKTAGAIAGA
jgi:hypothetical protein